MTVSSGVRDPGRQPVRRRAGEGEKDLNGQLGGYLGIYEKSLPDSLDLREKMVLFRKAGYDCFELSIDESDDRMGRLDWGESQILKFREMMEEQRIYAYSICLSANRRYPIGDRDPAVRERGFSLIRKAVDLALRTGVRILLIPGYDARQGKEGEDTRRMFGEALGRAASYASGRGVMLALENIERPFMDTVESAMHYVSAIETPYLQCYVDPGNLIAAGVPAPLEQVRHAQGHIAAVHLKDGRPGEFKHVPYGAGKLDFGELFRIIGRENCLPYCVAEVNASEDEKLSFENICRVRKFLVTEAGKIFRECPM